MAKQCQVEPEEEKSCLIDAIIYGTSIVKAQEKLLQTPKSLTLDQCLGICRHYGSLKLHLDTIKPKSVEYLQKQHNKSKSQKSGQGHGWARFQHQMAKSPGKTSNDRRSVGGRFSWKCFYCGAKAKHKRMAE